MCCTSFDNYNQVSMCKLITFAINYKYLLSIDQIRQISSLLHRNTSDKSWKNISSNVLPILRYTFCASISLSLK